MAAPEKEKVLTAKERLFHVLFGRSDTRHRDIKFMRGDDVVSPDTFYDAVAAAITRRRGGITKPVQLTRLKTEPVRVKDYVDSL